MMEMYATKTKSYLERRLIQKEIYIRRSYLEKSSPFIRHIAKIKTLFEVPRFIIKEDGSLEYNGYVPPKAKALLDKAEAHLALITEDCRIEIEALWAGIPGRAALD